MELNAIVLENASVQRGKCREKMGITSVIERVLVWEVVHYIKCHECVL